MFSHHYRSIALALSAAVFQGVGMAQPAPTITVKLLEGVDSALGSAGKEYRAAVSVPLRLGNTAIPVGTPAIVTLAAGTGGPAWTLHLTAMTLDGKTYRILGQNPQVVPVSVTDALLIHKGATSTATRIAVAAGLSVRFTLAQLAPAANKPAAAPEAVSEAAGRAAPTAGGGPGMPAIPTRGNLAPEAGVQVGDPAAVFESQGFRVRLVGCGKEGGASVTCDFQVTNIGEDGRRVSPGAGHGYGAIDSKGQPIAMRSASLANSGSPWVDAAAGVTMAARITMAGVDPDVNSLFRVPFSLRLFPASFSYFEWRNVSLNGPGMTSAPVQGAPVQAAASSGAGGATVEVEGYRLTALRCNSIAGTTRKLNDTVYVGGMDYVGNLHLDPTHPLIECFFRIENTRANRNVLLDGAAMIGNDGNTYDGRSKMYAQPLSRLGWIGEEADYQKAKTVPYSKPNNEQAVSYAVAPPGAGWGFHVKYGQDGPPLQAGTPEYFWGVFVGPDRNMTAAAQIRLGLRTSRANGGAGYYQIAAVFRDIPIVPLSSAAVREITTNATPKPTPASVTAEAALAKFWQRTIAKCGQTWYTRAVKDPYRGLSPSQDPLYTETEYRGAKLSAIRRWPVSETDKMNGLEWKASNMLQATALRERAQNEDRSWGPWTEWRPFLVMENPTAIAQKKNGRVTFLLTQEVAYEDLEQQVLDGPSCSDFR